MEKKIIILLCVCFVGCHKKTETAENNYIDSSQETVSTNFLTLTNMEEKNIRVFVDKYNENPDHYIISELEMNLEIKIFSQYLTANGYEKINDFAYNQRINQIFDLDKRKEKGENEIINHSQFFYIPIAYYENYSKLTEQEKATIIEEDGLQSDENVVFVKKHNFIIIPFTLSELFDPSTPPEEQKVFQKRMLENNFHLNKYLFNDDKNSRDWLINNYLTILSDLIDIFHYDKEPKINKAVLNDIYQDCNTDDKAYNRAIQRVFAAKDCYGNLQIHEGLMKYIFEVTTKEDNEFLQILNDYTRLMNHLTPKQTGFTKEEIIKIKAYAGYYSQLTYDKVWDNELASPDKNWNEVSYFYNLAAFGDSEIFRAEVERNNYYGLPNFANMIEKMIYWSEVISEEWHRTHESIDEDDSLY